VLDLLFAVCCFLFSVFCFLFIVYCFLESMTLTCERRFFVAGPVGDRFILWKARRNNGIMEPEHRLWLYSILLVFTPGGLLLWGLGAAHHVHWFGLIFAMGMLATCIAVGVQLPVNYCIDSYKSISGDAMVTVILVRNTMVFAVNYG
jgi:hypothetical protein